MSILRISSLFLESILQRFFFHKFVLTHTYLPILSIFSGCSFSCMSILIKSNRTILLSFLYFIVSLTKFIKNSSTSFIVNILPITSYKDGKNTLQVFPIINFKLGEKIFLPILRNSLSSSKREFVLIPKAQLPITSVVNFAAKSRHSTISFFFITSSKYFSKFPALSTIRENISFSFPDVNIGESFIRIGRHLSASNKKRCCVNGSIYLQKKN